MGIRKHEVPIDKILPNPYDKGANHPEEMEALVISIRASGSNVILAGRVILRETHRTPPRYKISDFFSSLIGLS